MRIVAGQWRGRPLLAPADKRTRPTADRVREALFSILISKLGSLGGIQVADLFAGTGALGLEALSRGAAHVRFVEHDRAALDALRHNIDRLGAGTRATVFATRVEHIGRAPCPHDLLLLDPPYGQDFAATALARLSEQGWIAPHALLSIETERTETLTIEGFLIEDVRDYGKARLHILRRS